MQGRGENSYNIWVGKPERNRSFARNRLRWEENIELELREKG
jgi:hypothetical protein